MTKLRRTSKGNEHIIVIQDYFTKYVEAYPVPDETAETTAAVLTKEWIAKFGVPRYCHSDMGRNFISKVFKGVCSILGIKKTVTTPYRPQSDGMVERSNRTITAMLRCYLTTRTCEWDEDLSLITMAYRSAVHESTRKTPNMMTFGRELNMPFDIVYGCAPKEQFTPDPYVNRLRQRLRKAYETVRGHLKTRVRRQKINHDTKLNEHKFMPGEFVWLTNMKIVIGATKKLQPRYEGPYLIIQKLSDRAFVIQERENGRMRMCHHDRMYRYYGDKPKWTNKKKVFRVTTDDREPEQESDSEDEEEIETENEQNDVTTVDGAVNSTYCTTVEIVDRNDRFTTETQSPTDNLRQEWVDTTDYRRTADTTLEALLYADYSNHLSVTSPL
jgi:hypothetical protein